MTPAESAARLLLHLLTLRGIHATDIPAAINAGHLTERDWCLTLNLMAGWEEGKAEVWKRGKGRRDWARRKARREAA